MGLFNSASYMSSHGNLKPVRSLHTLLFAYLMIPIGAIAYKLSSGSILITIAAALAVPLYGFSQGAWGVMKYRYYFRNAPTPMIPCHGVVICGKPKKSESATTSTENCTSTTFTDLKNSDSRRPIRLLVIGDSLAIGVGQIKNGSPVMPEVIAKTLSTRLDGRCVYWSCHGASGASTGWIIHELEHGVKSADNDSSCLDEDDDSDDEKERNNSDTDESNASEESAALASPPQPRSKVTEVTDTSIALKEQRTIWRKRLAQHRKYLEPDRAGQYDIVVVMAGGNDIKNALFPFLSSGKDAELRRQAMTKDGNYTILLENLVHIVNRDVRTKLRQIRHTVEVAAETVIEKVEQNMERIAKSTASPTVRRLSARASSLHEILHAKNEQSSNRDANDVSDRSIEPPRPLVVLPGIASRCNPSFRPVPLNWAVVLIFDIMDMHKRRLAKLWPDKVLFIPPSSPNELVEYESCQGPLWEQRCNENPILVLRDTCRNDCRRIEKEMREFYGARGKRQLSGVGFKIKVEKRRWLPSYFAVDDICPGLCSMDRIHANDEGYDAWGRQIGNAIADEWLVNPKMIPPE